jgi:predicted dehydrogenase
MATFNRRDFLKDSAFLAAAMAGAGALRAAEPETVKGKDAPPSDQLRVAVIGVRSRGLEHVHRLSGKHGCVITTICDADEAVIGLSMQAVETEQGKAPKYVQDIRKVVEDKNIDIITIATPNHWHALAAIWGLQNGKHVYVEKPVSHNVSEGRRIAEVAAKSNKLCQAGMQSRSSSGMRAAMQFLHDGKLGKVKLARGLCYKRRKSIGKVTGEQPIPSTIDYDLWCGPAPKTPLMRKSLHYDWHWVWDYGCGDLGNQGIHEMDKARWGLNKSELPRGVISVGGRFGYVDDGQTPNTQIAVFDYGDCELIFEVRGLESETPYPAAYKNKGKRGDNFVGNVFYGTEGVMVCPSYSEGIAFTNEGELIKDFRGGEDHFGNFIKAVRSGKREDLNAEVLEGHLSSALCHLGNVSYRLGTLQPFSKQTKTLGDDKEAAATMERMVDHLKDNKVALDDQSYHVGRKLTIDPKTETFIGDKDANAMLTREYRKGFVVPDKA